MLYEKSSQRINELIQQKKFTEAILLINKSKKKTRCARHLANLEMHCLNQLGRPNEALAVYGENRPVDIVDRYDLEALDVLCETHENLGNKFWSEKFSLIKELYTENCQGKNDRLESILCHEEKLAEKVLSLGIISDEAEKLMRFLALQSDYASISILCAALKRLDFSYNYVYDFLPAYVDIEALISRILLRQYEKVCIANTANSKRSKTLQVIKCCFESLGIDVYEVKADEENEARAGTNDECGNGENLSKRLLSVYKSEPDCTYLLLGECGVLEEANEYIDLSKQLFMFYSSPDKTVFPAVMCLNLSNYKNVAKMKYGINYADNVQRHYDLDFSIILPVRNTATYLKETVTSCLNQDYAGRYEILISDNSTAGDAVYRVVSSINSDVIRYIKTPCDLSLNESFEFAYLNARGNRLISIGADDALMPDALSILDNASKAYPDESVIFWKNATYLWNGFDKVHSNKLTYETNDPISRNPVYIGTKELILAASQREKNVLEIPCLYLQTCVKRELIWEIIDKTGKFEDGYSQDVYTGFLVLHMREKVLYLPYPVAISGNSTASIGYNAQLTPRTYDAVAKRKQDEAARKANANLFNVKCRQLMTFGSPFGDYMLMYGEFLKVNRYLLDGVNRYRDEDAYNALLKTYYAIPYEHCDVSFAESIIETAISDCGKKFSERFYTLKSEYDIQRKKNSNRRKLKNSLKKSSLLRKLNYIQKNLMSQKKYLIAVSYNTSHEDKPGIIAASRYLADYIN